MKTMMSIDEVLEVIWSKLTGSEHQQDFIDFIRLSSTRITHQTEAFSSAAALLHVQAPSQFPAVREALKVLARRPRREAVFGQTAAVDGPRR